MVTALRLRLMTATEFESFRMRLVHDYAADHVRAGTWSIEEAETRAGEQTSELLPDGPDTDGMLLLTAEDEEGQPVGVLWLSLTHPQGATDTAWIYDIEVVAKRRGEGYGRALLCAAEHEVRRRGIGTLGLNVFGDNDAARTLYQSAGYEVVTQQMRKRLS